jgi:hypothetical protein
MVCVVKIIEAALSETRDNFPDGITEAWARSHLRLAYKWTGYSFLKTGNSKAAFEYFISSLKRGIDLKTLSYAIFALVKIMFAPISLRQSDIDSTIPKR